MKVSAQYASTHFEELSTAVDGGEIVEIERAEKPALRLVLVERMAEGMRADGQQTGAGTSVPGKRILGAGKAKIRIPSDEEWAELDREMEREMLDAPLMTTGEI